MNSALAIRPTPTAWRHVAVLGLGKTGCSVARYLTERGISVEVHDSRDQPPFKTALQQACPSVPIHCGDFSLDCLDRIDLLVVSPGISMREPILREAKSRDIEILGDIELFARANSTPVIAITGSNGKTTVTTLVSDMLRADGRSVGVGGNIGTPALDLLDHAAVDVVVLELSSFQLETTHSLNPKVATILNISADHMDRYPTFAAYAEAKRRILTGAEAVILNRDDEEYLRTRESANADCVTVGLSPPPREIDYGISFEAGGEILVRGRQPLLPVNDLSFVGRHNVLNALTAIALVETAGYPVGAPMLACLSKFPGLSHRCEVVLEKDGIIWINDSKSTNPGSAAAALNGIARPIVLIAGGQSKGADFSGLADVIQRFVRQVLLIGQDRLEIAAAVQERVPVTLADDLAHAIRLASRWAQPGDAVLLSPACASFDMFKNFEHRGDAFRALVRELVA